MPTEFEFPPLDSTIADAVNTYSLEMLSYEADPDGKFSGLRDIAIGMAPDFAIHAATP